VDADDIGKDARTEKILGNPKSPQIDEESIEGDVHYPFPLNGGVVFGGGGTVEGKFDRKGLCACGSPVWQRWSILCWECLTEKRERTLKDWIERDPDEAKRLAGIWGMDLSAGPVEQGNRPAPSSSQTSDLG
jgi:hypothetical protein